jgi:hypothetical protein
MLTDEQMQDSVNVSLDLQEIFERHTILCVISSIFKTQVCSEEEEI